MDLKNYLLQETPQKSQSVALHEGDYRISLSFKRGSDRVSQVFITNKAFVEKFGLIEYSIVNNSGRLYTIDSDGNPNRASVFFINNK